MKLSELYHLSRVGLQIIFSDGLPVFRKKFRVWRRQRALLRQQLRSIVIDGEDRIPPPELSSYVGGGDFRVIGHEFFRYFKNLCDLKPHESILDVGCGIGRMALPLTKYMDESGKYEGFDTVTIGIDWCNKNISAKYPNFHFQLAPIYNKAYNPSGKIPACKFIFPYQDKSFDFVFLTSVFTHMLPEDMEHYFAEINRVLKNQGRCLITYYLINDESNSLIEQGKSSLNFKYIEDNCRYDSRDVPEIQVAYDEDFIRGIFKNAHFNIRNRVYYGTWCGRNSFPEYEGKDVCLSYQDIVIADKLS